MFDEQPEGDPHGECAAEIRRLHALNVELVEALEFIENLYSYEASVGENARALYDAKTRARYALAKAAS